jgi:hypothetical protein
MLLYHGCSIKGLEGVLQGGLQPRGEKESTWRQLQSNPHMVYLTDAFPFFFARQAGHQIVAVEFEIELLDVNSLYPDEDYLVQTLSISP